VDERQRDLWGQDARVLAEVGSAFAETDIPSVEVRLPQTLADLALAAWEREDADATVKETCEQRLIRHRAAALALIGLAIRERGRREGGEIIVELSPDLVGAALTAADDLPWAS
jgi:hypothetical protein